MNSNLPAAFFCWCVFASGAHAAFTHPVPQTELDFLYAVREVESGDHYDCPPGRAGELGAYQFKREVWARYTRAEFSRARTPESDEIADRHYSWLVAQLQRRGFTASAWNIAAAWNGGMRTVLAGRISAATRDYADRVANLVQDAAALRLSMTPKIRIALAATH